ncbi:hypothetical protein B0A48_08557 [Cryoendolithus antarcticus]|uniref:Uncharacterized protein n=1 Tax=Cryoendolithus antarcticus TaxID=1507870 RepID=A0A1V8T617_9PEZI|nr:hypothetical protein B0A48_08557 [Cryoendolithus antarcticus]
MDSATRAAGSRPAEEGSMSRTRSPVQRSPSATPPGPYSLECRSVLPTTDSTLRRRRRKRTGLIDTPSRKTQRGRSDIDPSYSTDEEQHAMESRQGAHILDIDWAERSTTSETNTVAGDSHDSVDAEASELRRVSLVSGGSPGKMIAQQCHDIASGAPTMIGGLHFNGLADEVYNDYVFVCAASGPGNFDRTPQSLEKSKRKLRKMVLTQSPSSSNAVPAKPSTAPDPPPARTISPGSGALKAVSKAEKLQVPPFDLDAPLDLVSDAVKKSRQLIKYARDTSEIMHSSSSVSTPDRSFSLRASPAQRPVAGPVVPLTLKQLSREQIKRDSVITPKVKGKAIPPITPASQRGQASLHQLSPTAKSRLSSDDLCPGIYKSPALGSPYHFPTIAERATGSRNVSGLSKPRNLRDVLLDGARRSATAGEGVEVHDFAAGERNAEGLSEVNWCRASTSTKSTPSKQSLSIQLKSGGWLTRAPKSTPIVETSSVDAELVNASMSRLYDVGSPLSTTSMIADHSGQSATIEENTVPTEATEAMLPAKLKVKRRKRLIPHFAPE